MAAAAEVPLLGENEGNGVKEGGSSSPALPHGVPRLLWTMTLNAAFAGIGVALAMLGPTLLELAEQLEVPLSKATSLFTCRATGYLLGALLGGELDRMPSAAAVLLGPTLCACLAASALPYTRSYLLAVVLFAFQGVSMGVLDTGGNAVLMALWRGSKFVNGFMHALHFFFGLGAFVAPFFLSVWLDLGHSTVSAWLAAAVAMAPGCLGLALLLPFPQPRTAEDTKGEAPAAVSSAVIFAGAFLFAYIGLEVSYGGYIDAYSVRWLDAPKADAARLTSVYWGLLCLGRLVAAILTPHVHHAWYLASHLLLAFAALLALGLATGSEGAAATVIAAGGVGSAYWWAAVVAPTACFGFALAPLFPGAMLIAEELQEGEITGRAASVMVMSASAGEMALPLGVGLLFAWQPSSFAWGQLVLAVAATAIFWKNGVRLLRPGKA